MKTKQKPYETIKMKLSQLELFLKDQNLPIAEELQGAIDRNGAHNAILDLFKEKDGSMSMKVSFMVPTKVRNNFKKAI